MADHRTTPGRGALALALLLGAVPALARAELTVSANLSQDRVYVGEVVTLEVTAVVTGDGDIVIDVPTIAGLDELRRGTSDSTSISWTGAGQTIRRERTLRVDFEARKPGAVTIPPIEVRLGNESRKTNALTVTVGGEAEPDADPAAPGQKPQAGMVAPPEAGETDIFIRYRVDKARAYVGEQILLDLDIFTNGNISLDENKPPVGPDGFWREILERSDRLVGRVERVGGREYRVYRLWRIALFGIEPGERTIPPTQLSFSSNRSIFSAGQRTRRSTPPIKLSIEALPPQPRARPLAGVGVYTLEAGVDQTTVPAGKGALLTLSLAGAGNVTAARLPELKSIDGFRVFPPRASDAVQRTLNGVTGTKRAEVLLVPTRGGRIEIPAITATVFNPDKGEYEDLSTTPIVISAEGDGSAGAALAAPAPTGSAAPAPAGAAPTLRPIRFPGSLDRGPPRFAGRPVLWGALLAPPLLLGLVVLVQAARSRPRAETASTRARRVAADARARLDAAKPSTAYAEASEAVLAVASARVGRALRGLTLEDAASALRRAGADDALVSRVTELLRTCDFARFAPGGGDASARSIVAEARALVDALEEAPLSGGASDQEAA